ncbi:MAG: MSMEG_1061 family FMN-dependent PPOX-type flavoprotein [Pseudomonadales bacterium]
MSNYDITSVAELREVISEPNPLVAGKVSDALDDYASAYIGAAPLLFMATYDSDGRVDISPKGDAPGFVLTETATELLVPERKGNKLNYGFLNILETGRIGLIFVVPGSRETLRVNGRATISRDPELLARLAADDKPALLCTKVQVEESFFHCGKAMIRSHLWDQTHWPKDFDPGLAKQLGAKMRLSKEQTAALDQALEDDYRNELY